MFKTYKYTNLSFDEIISKRNSFNRLKSILTNNHPDRQFEFITTIDPNTNSLTLKIWTGNLN